MHPNIAGARKRYVQGIKTATEELSEEIKEVFERKGLTIMN
jgi:hypothetical protein